LRDIERAAIAQARQRHMRRELAWIGRQAEPLADAVDLALQPRQVGGSRDAGPHCMRLLAAEGADAGERHLERGAVNPVEGVGDLVGDMALDIADETQRQMVVFDIDPARSGQPAAEQGQRESGITRNFEGGEKTWHVKPPVLESKLSALSESSI